MKTGRILISLICTGAIVFCGYVAFNYNKAVVGKDYHRRKLLRMSLDGTRDPIPGPYLSAGTPGNLHFKPIDLGISEFLQMSEEGDVLYRTYGDQPERFVFTDVDGFLRTGLRLGDPKIRLLRRDGTKTDFDPQITKVLMTPVGKLSYMQKNKQGRDAMSLDGKNFIVPGEKDGNADWLDLDFYRAMDQGYFSDSGTYGDFTYIRPDLTKVKVPQDKQEGYQMKTGSSRLGSFGFVMNYGFWSDVFPKNRMINLKDGGAISIVDLPEDCEQPALVATRNSLFMMPSGIYSTSFLYEFVDGKFTKLPIPPDCAELSLNGANSNHEFLLWAKPTGKTVFDAPPVYIFVSGGKYISVKDITDQLGLPMKGLGDEPHSLSEHGDFLINTSSDNFKRLILLRRTP